ncbi:PEP/pyruvate-binding domain-containing protein [Oerskovia rustica]|uniref:Pyruvate, phosphate dikinase n=1 Tax=Oerskovia rustica TaxID=2762237 RepID=A0ABR8RV47_9CELL|nr:PEP/pyruvate-binding domain-containing protein [Oerskovia rustica]MBD7951666.1 pyruvate, phosphate dikinase [Oerskovia rustica]
MLVPLEEAARATCGGKATALGALLRAGLPVPDGFVVPFDVHRAAVPDDVLRDALASALRTLGSPPVAVRSSAAGEDTAQASAAGQHESVLAVQAPDDVAHAVRACWASLHSPRAVDYRAGLDADGGDGAASGEPAMAVLVQRLVDAEVSGVMFAPDDPDDPTVIEASWGLGPSVVGGTVTPDTYRVVAHGALGRRAVRVASRVVADKQTRLDRDDTRLVTRDVPPGDRLRSTLDDATVFRLTRLGWRAANLLGGPQDVEWALADGMLWIVQARPITAPLPAPSTDVTGSAPRLGDGSLLRGTAGSTGVATGPARIVRGPADFSRVRPGDVLVCPFTDPAWTPLLRIAAGVVTETGGVLSHAAIVARERRIPAVVGVTGATGLIADGSLVTVDGEAGTVADPRTLSAPPRDGDRPSTPGDTR